MCLYPVLTSSPPNETPEITVSPVVAGSWNFYGKTHREQVCAQECFQWTVLCLCFVNPVEIRFGERNVGLWRIFS